MRPQDTLVTSQTAVQPAVSSTWNIPFLRTETDRLLFLSMLFSLLLSTARMIHTGTLAFLFLPWNLFLAYIPYFISSLMTGMRRRGFSWWTLALIWLLFIPNSFYIITDLFHLRDNYFDRQTPLWFDLAAILSYAWNGLLLGILSVRQMERLLIPRQNLRSELLFLYPIMWLNALGVYIGRFLRYNSWDVVTDPFQLLRDIAVLIVHPLRHRETWDMVLCFSILMTLIYLMMKRLHKSLI